MREFGIRPNRDLGQNFLVDSNVLDVIGRAAELAPEDVVLEVGGGLGVLSEYLAERVDHVHVVELDRDLEFALRDALDPHPNTTLHFADAVKLDLEALDPAPNKVVANLPYGVAATVILQDDRARERGQLGRDGAEGGRPALRGRPEHAPPTASRRCWPSSPATCAIVKKVPRGVFHPVPNVDSVLVGLKRHSPAPPESLRKLVQQGFAHRRKALARSLSLAPNPRREHPRAHPRGARGARPPRRRPRRVALARRNGARCGSGCAEHARAGQGEPLPADRRAAAPTGCTRSSRSCSPRSSPTR